MDQQVNAAIAQAQESGQLTTGFKRWRMRKRRRQAEQLRPEERWECAACGKLYRSTSSKSIRLHAHACAGGHDYSSSRHSLSPRPQRQREATAAAHRADQAMESQQQHETPTKQPLPPPPLPLSLRTASTLPSASSSSPPSLPSPMSQPPAGADAVDGAKLDSILLLCSQRLLQVASELQRCVQSLASLSASRAVVSLAVAHPKSATAAVPERELN
jgi:hypothetical protein